MTRAPLVAIACAAAAVGAGAAPWPAPLALQGPGPYYTLRLPMALESAAQRDDFGDLRVRNAAGETLPYAWLPERTEAQAPQEAKATIYAVPAPAPSASAPLPAHAWIVDTQDAGFALERLVLGLAPEAQGVWRLQVEASNDLQRWHGVEPSAQLVQLAAPKDSGATAPLRASVVELGGIGARYLRLASAAGEPAPALVSATVVRSRHVVLERSVEWSAAIAPSSCDDRHCDYAMPRNVPVEQLQIVLAEPNTVGPLDVLAEVEAAAAPVHRHHLLRGTLHALRDKERGAVSQPGWSWIAEANAWWLRDVAGVAELRSPPLRLDAGPQAALRLQSPGSLRTFGPTPPSLRVGAHPATLVFLARGPAPYRLELAAADEASPAMTLEQLMPARKSDDPLPADSATPAVAPSPAAPASAPARVAAHAPSTDAPWLWAALLAGVGLMAVMAWSLLRRPADPPPEA